MATQIRGPFNKFAPEAKHKIRPEVIRYPDAAVRRCLNCIGEHEHEWTAGWRSSGLWVLIPEKLGKC